MKLHLTAPFTSRGKTNFLTVYVYPTIYLVNFNSMCRSSQTM